jgi:hypothetical protein
MPYVSFRLLPSFIFASVPIALLACATESASSAPESSPKADVGGETNTGEQNADTPRAPVGATSAPDGNGVCCPLENPCGPGYRGGWAAKASDCQFVKSWDGSHDRRTDAHGCEQWILRGIAADADLCCMCTTPDASDSG